MDCDGREARANGGCARSPRHERVPPRRPSAAQPVQRFRRATAGARTSPARRRVGGVRRVRGRRVTGGSRRGRRRLSVDQSVDRPAATWRSVLRNSARTSGPLARATRPLGLDGTPLLRDRRALVALLRREAAVGARPAAARPRAGARRRPSLARETPNSMPHSRLSGRARGARVVVLWPPSSTRSPRATSRRGSACAFGLGRSRATWVAIRRGGGEWPLAVEADFGAAREARASVLDPATYTALVRAAAEMRRVREGDVEYATAARAARRTSRSASGYGCTRSGVARVPGGAGSRGRAPRPGPGGRAGGTPRRRRRPAPPPRLTRSPT
jgi:hypothetical protein